MKRLLIIAILISYSVASFGVQLNYFYCCGKLKTVSLTANSTDKDCTGKDKKGCCDNKTVTLKLNVDQKDNEQVIFHLVTPLSPAFLHTNYNFTGANITTAGNINQLCKMPPYNLPSRNILYCVFRI